MSFYNTGNPVPSDDPRDLDDNAKHIDEIVNSTELSTTDRQGRAIRTLAGLQYDASQGTLRTDLAAPGGAELVGHGSSMTAISTHVAAFIDGGALNAKTHGGAILDGGIHPLSEIYSTLAIAKTVYPFVTSLDQSIDWAAIRFCQLKNRPVYIPGNATINEGLYLGRTSYIFGDGCDRWDSVRFDAADQLSTFQKEDSMGTQLAFYGNGAKIYRQYGISDCSDSGGMQIVNGKLVKLLNFTNGDSVGGSIATPRMYSAAVRAESGARIENLRIVHYKDGIQGYKDYESVTLAADWDVGLDLTGCWNGRFRNVQAVGYWRMAGLLLSVGRTTDATGSDVNGNGERNIIENCMFQGLRGISVRGYDRVKVVSSTENSLTIPCDPSFHWTDGTPLSFFGAQGTVSFNYSGQVYNSAPNTMTLTGITPAITGQVYEVRPRIGSNGISFTCFINCYAMGLEHGSRLLAEDLGLGPSGPIEISGMGIRQPSFINTKFQTHETIAGYLHDCLSVRMPTCQFEGKTGRTELVATPYDSGPNIVTANQRGHTDDLYAPELKISPSVGKTAFNPRGADLGIIKIEGIADADFPAILRNWRIGPTYLAGDSGSKFIKVPASNDALQDLTITSERYGLTTSSTDVNLQIKGSTNLSIRNSSNAVTAKILQSGRFEFTNVFVPAVDGAASFGATTNRASDTFSRQITIGSSGIVRILSGTGSPEGLVSAVVSTIYLRSDGGASTSFYVKQSGSGNTGWVAK